MSADWDACTDEGFDFAKYLENGVPTHFRPRAQECEESLRS